MGSWHMSEWIVLPVLDRTLTQYARREPSSGNARVFQMDAKGRDVNISDNLIGSKMLSMMRKAARRKKKRMLFRVALVRVHETRSNR